MDGIIWWTSLCGNRSLDDAFWNPSQSLNTSNPDFSQCFQNTVLTWIPCGILVLSSPIYLLYLHHKTNISFSRSKLNWCKVIISTLLCILSIISLALNITNSSESVPVDFIAPALELGIYTLTAYFAAKEYTKGVHTSGVLWIFWFLSFITNTIILRSYIISYAYQNRLTASKGNIHTAAEFVFYTKYALICIQFLLSFLADRNVFGPPTDDYDSYHEITPLMYDKPSTPETGYPCPEQKATFICKITHWWITGFLIRGYRKGVRYEDLYDLRPQDRCDKLVNEYYQINPQFNKHTEGATWLLIKTYFKILFPTIAKQGLYRFLLILMIFANPVFLSLIINFVDEQDPYTWKGVLLAVLLFALQIIILLVAHVWLLESNLLGLRARSISNAIIYRKALRLSSGARRNTTVGEVVNLMSVDSQKLQDSSICLHVFWDVIFLVIMCIYQLYTTVGPASLAGLAVLLILLPTNGLYLANRVRKFQATQMVIKDSRIRMLGEMLAGIKVLKFYAWENSFMSKVLGARDKEIATIRKIEIINAISSMTWFLAPYLVSLAIFTVYTVTDPNSVLDANTAFVSLSLINILNFPLSLLPLSVSYIGQAYTAFKRMGRFLAEDELDYSARPIDVKSQSDIVIGGPNAISDNTAIQIEKGSFTWDVHTGATLKNITLRIPKHKLVAVVGNVGAGKSSLVSAILGEMTRTEGQVHINGSLAYIPQQAWILNATVRDNILFGKPFRYNNYKQLLGACALEEDLKILPGGDQTEIGEKGINLSGGQKQRISLARAVYHSSDIYLLDDPLSAVDAHVGKHIFKSVLGPEGVLKHKTRLLVTHNIAHLPNVDLIITMDNGQISEVGTFKQLISHNGAFAEFVRNYMQEQTDVLDEELKELDQVLEMSDGSISESFSDKLSSITERRRLHRSQSQQSALSRKSRLDEQAILAQQNAKLIEKETEAVGRISWKVIYGYVKAGGCLFFNLTIWCHLFFIASKVLTDIWLSSWTNDIMINGTRDHSNEEYRLSVYGMFGFGQLFFVLIESFSVAFGCVIASQQLHAGLLKKVFHAPMSFFDTTPLGRIMNRFSKDMDIVDANMPLYIRQWLFAMAPFLATIVIIIYSTPIFLAVVFPVAVLYVIIQFVYIYNVRQMKRIDSVRRSPIFAHFDESLQGVASIRAYKKEDEFVEKCDRLIDESQKAWYLYCVAQRWLGVTMESLGALLVFFATLFAVLQRDTLGAGIAGLSVTYALQLTLYTNVTVRSAAELETYAVAVERIQEYNHIPAERDWALEETKPTNSWPDKGEVEFKKYSTRYRPGLDLVVKGITCFIKAGERVGIVGRTGAGKSSLTLALFRILESAEGSIYIDGLRIADLGLHQLRSKLTIIPQDPVLFSGTLRDNLDPFGKYSDNDIWRALKHAHLERFVAQLYAGLEYQVGENGDALSIGQKQLVCLARALLKKTRVLILDEATAAVDLETDDLIQNTIKTQFSDATVLTIAHRLNTVLDYDRVMVMRAGNILEFDSPQTLLDNTTSLFYDMAKDAGIVA